MAGTKAGGQKAAAKNLAKDPNFYAKIGSKGGKNGNTGGFAANPELARIAGKKGGTISRRKAAAKVAVEA
jgi:general stress protein YciG